MRARACSRQPSLTACGAPAQRPAPRPRSASCRWPRCRPRRVRCCGLTLGPASADALVVRLKRRCCSRTTQSSVRCGGISWTPHNKIHHPATISADAHAPHSLCLQVHRGGYGRGVRPRRVPPGGWGWPCPCPRCCGPNRSAPKQGMRRLQARCSMTRSRARGCATAACPTPTCATSCPCRRGTRRSSARPGRAGARPPCLFRPWMGSAHWQYVSHLAACREMCKCLRAVPVAQLS